MADHELLIARHTALSLRRVWDDTLRRFRPPCPNDGPREIRWVVGLVVVDMTGPWARYKVWVRAPIFMNNILALPPGRVLLEVEDETFQRMELYSAPYQPGDTLLLANPKIEGIYHHLPELIQHGAPRDLRFKGVKSR